MRSEYLNYLVKARENLRIAEYSFEQKCFNVCVSRAYYAMLQAALAALAEEGIRAPGAKIDHGWVQASFNERLIKRKKVYPSGLAPMLVDTMSARHVADYETRLVSHRMASTALRSARTFVESVLSIVEGEG